MIILFLLRTWLEMSLLDLTKTNEFDHTKSIAKILKAFIIIVLSLKSKNSNFNRVYEDSFNAERILIDASNLSRKNVLLIKGLEMIILELSVPKWMSKLHSAI